VCDPKGLPALVCFTDGVSVGDDADTIVALVVAASLFRATVLASLRLCHAGDRLAAARWNFCNLLKPTLPGDGCHEGLFKSVGFADGE
jgi:hypothetical protein